MSISAQAQTSTYSNTNTSGNAIGDGTTCGTASLTRTFVVPGTDDFTIGDLDVGFLASHSYRGDIRVDLTAPDPASTTVRIIASNTGAGGGYVNYNIELDDDNTTALNTFPHNSGDGLTAPPYENQVSPSNALSVFTGLNSVGTWTLTICDDYFGADAGAFLRSDLYFTHLPPPTDADLSMAITASDTTPNTGTNVVLTYTINNSALSLTADGITADITLPAGLSYVSDNAGGGYNSTTGVWTVLGSIAAGDTVSLQITAFTELSGSYVTSAEILTSNQSDPDSTPGNSVTTEDDYDSLTLVPVTPPVPSLVCPGAASVVDWDTEVWAEGSTNNTYNVDGEDITLTVTAAAGVLLNNATFGGQSPAEQTTFTGGYSPVESNVGVLANQPSQSSTVDIDLSLGTFGTGVSKFQMTLFDIDFGTSQFQDQITIAGSLNGTPVSATYLTGTSYTMSGDVATGTTASNSNLGNGNLTIEFANYVDTINITYGNGSGAPADPGQQGIGIHDLFFCPPTNAVLTAQKTTAVYDPLSEGLYAIPGNDVIYTIEFTNSGTGPADTDSVEIIDEMPSEIEFYNGDIDDGGPLTDPVIGVDNGSGLSLDYGTDVKISKAATKPSNFASCTNDTLNAGYNPDVTFICLNPSGEMADGDPDPSFQIQFRARIK
ncbi:MAG: proprotein convertase, P [Hyphomonadaceae bacterium]|nr:proprotein convertase, P [Hyphomonadaceae bacterium]